MILVPVYISVMVMMTVAARCFLVQVAGTIVADQVGLPSWTQNFQFGKSRKP